MSTSQESTHLTLLARLRASTDQAAWRDFYDRYGELIRGFAKRRGLQPSDCDDVIQDTLIALTKSMPAFEYDPGKGSFRAYLKTIAIHIIFRKSYQKPPGRSLETFEEHGVPSAADEGAEHDWETEWRQYHLRLAMRSIEVEFNEKDRAAFDAYAVRGCDVRETAERLDMSADQVYQAKSRILRRIAEIVEGQVREEG